MTYRGIVERGDRRGSLIGFPSANIPLIDSSLSGIYVGRATLGARLYHAAVYADTRRGLLEAHLLDFAGGDLYDQEIEIEILEKIREDKRFANEGDLRAAIEGDIESVRYYFRK